MSEGHVSRRKPTPRYVTLEEILREEAIGPVRVGASFMDVVNAVGTPEGMSFGDESHWWVGFGVVDVNVSSLSGVPLVETFGFELGARGSDVRNMPFSNRVTWPPSQSLRLRMPAGSKRTLPVIRQMLEQEQLTYTPEVNLPVGEEVGEVLVVSERVSLYFDRDGVLMEVRVGPTFDVSNYPDFLAIRILLKARWPLPDIGDPWSFRRYNSIAWGVRYSLKQRQTAAELTQQLEKYARRFAANLGRPQLRSLVADLRRIKTEKFE